MFMADPSQTTTDPAPLAPPDPRFKAGAALAPLTYWQIGGPARFLFEAASAEEAAGAIAWARENGLPWVAIGKGSNLLVADAGFPGLVLRLGARMAAVRFEDGRMHAEAGANLAQMVMSGLAAGLGGLEPMVGVPGTVGGAVAMNASAHGVAISEGFAHGRVLLPDGTVATWSHADFDFRYRHSRLHDEPGVFLDGVWRLTPRDKAAGRARVLELQQWRNQKQPTNFPSGGSTFRNPGGDHPAAGALIEAVGGKGLRRGAAEVSEKHANFIVNRGGATAADVDSVIRELQTRVHDRFGVMLVPEVVGLGMTVGLPRP